MVLLAELCIPDCGLRGFENVTLTEIVCKWAILSDVYSFHQLLRKVILE